MPPFINRANVMLAVMFALLMLARSALTGCGRWRRRLALAGPGRARGHGGARVDDSGDWSPFREEIRRRGGGAGR